MIEQLIQLRLEPSCASFYLMETCYKSQEKYMEPVILTDKSVKPDNNLVFSIIGNKSALWQKVIAYLYNNYNDISEEWKFYNDGKSWLFRTLKKGKTIFWVGVLKDTFRITFWLSNKAETLIEQSTLPESIKNEFRNARQYKIGRSITITMNNANDVNNVIKLIEIKFKLR